MTQAQAAQERALREAEAYAGRCERTFGSNAPETRAAERKALALLRKMERDKERAELATFQA
jgi:hypothetical protein